MRVRERVRAQGKLRERRPTEIRRSGTDSSLAPSADPSTNALVSAGRALESLSGY